MTRDAADAETGAVTAEDAEAARNALYRYARAVDLADESLLAETFTEDVVLERVDGSRVGRAAVLAFYRTVFDGPTLWSKHMVTNVTTEATVEGLAVTAYFQTVSSTGSEAKAVFGEYRDVLVRQAGRLRIHRKRIDVQQSFPLAVRDA